MGETNLLLANVLRILEYRSKRVLGMREGSSCKIMSAQACSKKGALDSGLLAFCSSNEMKPPLQHRRAARELSIPEARVSGLHDLIQVIAARVLDCPRSS